MNGGHDRNRTGIQGFAVLCVTIPPRGQLGLQGSKHWKPIVKVNQLITSIIMVGRKKQKNYKANGPGMAQEIKPHFLSIITF